MKILPTRIAINPAIQRRAEAIPLLLLPVALLLHRHQVAAVVEAAAGYRDPTVDHKEIILYLIREERI